MPTAPAAARPPLILMHNHPLNHAQTMPHPQGGTTIAVPIPGTATARIYVGQFRTPRQAELSLELARNRSTQPCPHR